MIQSWGKGFALDAALWTLCIITPNIIGVLICTLPDITAAYATKVPLYIRHTEPSRRIFLFL